MHKLILNLDDLALQSFETTAATRAAEGTVVAHLDDTCDELGCSEACATQIYTCAGCETYDAPCYDDGGPDAGRRIIVYQSPG
jgi:hypothetical protein